MRTTKSILPLEMASFNTTGLTTGFKVVNTNGFAEAPCILRITNDSNKDVTVSYDGTNPHDYVVAGKVLQIVVPTSVKGMPAFKERTKVYVKGTGAGTGSVYLAAYYRLNV